MKTIKFENNKYKIDVLNKSSILVFSNILVLKKARLTNIIIINTKIYILF